MDIKGEHGWVVLAVYVWLWDWLAPETLSRSLWRGLAHPKKRWLVLLCWGWVSSHLLLKKPSKILWKW